MSSNDKETARLREILDYENPWVHLYFDEVRFPDGGTGRYNRIIEGTTGKGVVIIPRDNRNRLGLLRIFRYPTGTWEWEFPRGLAEPNLTMMENAQRELREETGLEAGELIPIGELWPNSGVLATGIQAYLAKSLRKVGGSFPTGEWITEIRFVQQRKIFDMIGKGQIRDGITLASMCLAITYNNFNKSEKEFSIFS